MNHYSIFKLIIGGFHVLVRNYFPIHEESNLWENVPFLKDVSYLVCGEGGWRDTEWKTGKAADSHISTSILKTSTKV